MMGFWRDKQISPYIKIEQKHSYLHRSTMVYRNSPVIRGNLHVYARASGSTKTTMTIPFKRIISGGLRPNQWYMTQSLSSNQHSSSMTMSQDQAILLDRPKCNVMSTLRNIICLPSQYYLYMPPSPLTLLNKLVSLPDFRDNNDAETVSHHHLTNDAYEAIVIASDHLYTLIKRVKHQKRHSSKDQDHTDIAHKSLKKNTSNRYSKLGNLSRSHMKRRSRPTEPILINRLLGLEAKLRGLILKLYVQTVSGSKTIR